jgi:hypothetical protein
VHQSGENMPISEQDISEAISAWGSSILEISKAYEIEGFEQARGIADNMLDKLYGFHLGPVLFKPTLSGGFNTFRQTKLGALSYFVGHDPNYPGDTGFGIKNWRDVRSEMAAVFLDERVAMWMGWVTFTDKNDNVTKVDKSWGYKLDEDGELKIMLHHSSLPYDP